MTKNEQKPKKAKVEMAAISRSKSRKPTGVCCGTTVFLLLGLACFVVINQNRSYELAESSLLLLSEYYVDASSFTGIKTTTSSTPTTTVSKPGINPIKQDLVETKFWVEKIWEDLIEEAANLKKSGQSPGVIMEVGMFSAKQCLQAAKAGVEAHCVEPSPTNFERIQSRVDKAPAEVKNLVTLYNVAAGDSSEGMVEFTSGGGTGDHIGTSSVWAMEPESEETKAQVAEKGVLVQVPVKRMDDIVSELDNGVFMIKIDTQGYEPAVFSGLGDTLLNHKAKYVLFEYWPKGIDLMANTMGQCKSVEILEMLLKADYTLYALSVSAHPAAGNAWKTDIWSRPFGSLVENCKWYYGLEDRHPTEDYKMGYWSDFLAVANGSDIPDPITKVGKLLHSIA